MLLSPGSISQEKINQLRLQSLSTHGMYGAVVCTFEVCPALCDSGLYLARCLLGASPTESGNLLMGSLGCPLLGLVRIYIFIPSGHTPSHILVTPTEHIISDRKRMFHFYMVSAPFCNHTYAYKL